MSCQILASSVYQRVGKKIAENLNWPELSYELKKFADGEIYLRIKEKPLQNIFLLGTTAPPGENLIELMLFRNALKQFPTKKIFLAIPYFGYARADRPLSQGEAVSLEAMANFLDSLNFEKIIFLDIHSQAINKFLKTPFLNLEGWPLLVNYFQEEIFSREKGDWIVVSPDRGACHLAQKVSKFLKIGFAWMEKRRLRPNEAKIIALHGNVKNKNVLLIDDMIDTGETIIKAAMFLKKSGALKIFAAATHPVFSKEAPQKLQKAIFEKVIVTNSIPLSPKKQFKKLKILSISSLFKEIFLNLCGAKQE